MLKYVKVTMNNLELATKIQMQIFPNESAYQEFLDCIHDDKEYNCYYIVYLDDEPIGITGLYTNLDVLYHTLWMGWFGILEPYRHKGWGKQVLLDTIEMAKKFCDSDIRYFRVFTSSVENSNALPLYESVMDFCEVYQNENDDSFHNSCVIYTKLLGNYEAEMWNNKFLNIKGMIEKEKIGNQKFG